MRTNIEIDDGLMAEAMYVLGAATKREAVQRALAEAITARRQLEAWKRMKGMGWEGDLDEMRTDKPLPSLD
jgi:Arc/MetJ family transcription regulator